MTSLQPFSRAGEGQAAVILIGHGSLRSASGASMIRIAARLRARGVAPLVEAAFLNYSRPTLAETVEKLANVGVTSITIQPYFLIAGAYVQNDLRVLIAEVSARYPSLFFRLAPVIGDHPAVVELAQRRTQAALELLQTRQAGNTDLSTVALLLMAHGTPLPAANAPLYAIAETLAVATGLSQEMVGYLDCNRPTIAEAFNYLVAMGATQIVALPYFLHLGRHVAEDLPRLMAEAQARHAHTQIQLAHHLDYDLCLVDAIQALLPAAEQLVQRAATLVL